MASELNGPKGQPYFTAEGSVAIDADPGIVADYAAAYGNYRADTKSLRLAQSPVWEGLTWWDTTDKLLYQHDGTSWKLADQAVSVSLRTATGQSSHATPGSGKAITWEIEDHKTQSSMHSNTTNPSRVIIPVPGIYLLTANVSNATTSFAIAAQFAKNGSVIPGTKAWSTPMSTPTFAIAATSKPVLLDAGDYVEAMSVAGAPSLSLTPTDCSFSVTLLGYR